MSKKLSKVFEGVRSWSVGTSQCSPLPAVEFLKGDNFQVGKVAIHGFPYHPTCLAVDPVQKLVAVGTKTGAIRIFGRPGVDCVVQHPSSSAVIQIYFLVNEGGLISVCQDSVVHLWNIRQKNPELVHSLQFKRERLTCGHVPVGSAWFYMGSDKGNVHVVSLQQFNTSGYLISWNKAIDLNQTVHPGRVVQIGENPQDPNKLLIGYSSGLVVLWDLPTKSAEARFKYTENLNGFCWHWEGKSFMTCHNFGLLVTWSCRQPQQPLTVTCPHAGCDALPDDHMCFESIQGVDWLPNKSGEPLIVFAGGGRLPDSSTAHTNAPIETPTTSADTASAEHPPSMSVPGCLNLTVKRGKRLVVLQMDHKLIQFVALSSSPYISELMDPYAIVVLLQDDLVVVDLLSSNYAIFENPYPMDLHIPPVTCCLYLVDCPGDLIPAVYSVGNRTGRKRGAETDSFSSREWPLTGGEWGQSYNPYPEMLLTGHADGSVRFWDASEMTLTPLYRTRTRKFFCTPPEASKQNVQSAADVNAHFSRSLLTTQPDLYAIRMMYFCPESRRLLTASNSHVCLLHFSKREQQYEIPVVDINMAYDCLDDLSVYGTGDAFIDDAIGGTMTKEMERSAPLSRQSDSVSSTHSAVAAADRDVRVFVAIRPGPLTWPPGYQPSLVCRMGIPCLGSDATCFGETSVLPPPITAISLNSTYNLLALGNEVGFALVNYHTRTCLLTTSTIDLCGPSDISTRLPNRSPGRVATSSSADGKSLDKSSSFASNTCGYSSISSNALFGSRNPTFDCATPLPDPSPNSLTSGRYGLVSRSAAFRGELKRAKSQEKWSELNSGLQTHSLSTSTSSLEHVANEGVRVVVFMDSYTRKNDTNSIPCLWFGTTRGNVLAMNLNSSHLRAQHVLNPLIPTGLIYRLSGEIVLISFLDAVGALLSSASSRWEECTMAPVAASSQPCRPAPRISNSTPDTAESGNVGIRQGDPSVAARRLGTETKTSKDSVSRSGLGTSSRTSSSSSSGAPVVGSANLPDPVTSTQAETDKQMLVVCSEKQACVISLPSQTCLAKAKITETSQVIRASVQHFPVTSAMDSNGITTFLACYLANGHFLAFSLPSLRMLVDVDYLPLTECVSRSFAFGQHGQAVYLTTPSELHKISWSADVCANLHDMQGDLFVPCVMPEMPKKSFFMNLLSGNLPSSVDRNELFGEASSGKGAPGTTTLLPSTRTDKLTGQTSAAASEISRARNAAIERGERLQQLDLHTQEMVEQAKGLGRTAALLAAKCEKKDKRWGWPL